MARKKHPGKKNSLDALCDRYLINRSNRQFHGALIDADLLAKVYLAITSGQKEVNDEKKIVNKATQEEINNNLYYNFSDNALFGLLAIITIFLFYIIEF